MKVVTIFSLAALTISVAVAQSETPTADVVMNAAKAKAAQHKKNIFVKFDASW